MKTTSDLIHLLLSLFLHLFVVLILLFRIFIFPSERPEFIQSVRVDLVALPDKDPQTGPAAEAPAPSEEAAKPEPVKEKPAVKIEKTEEPAFVEKKKDTPVKKEDAKVDDKKAKKENATKTADSQKSALDRLKALSKIKDLKSKQAAAKAIAEAQHYKGNALSEGSSLRGVEKLQHDQYLGKLDTHIKTNWQLPAWLANKPYSTAVWVRFDEKGLVLEQKVLRSSGNSAFDEQALQAVKNSVPFPAPPEHLVSYFKVRGIELRFPE